MDQTNSTCSTKTTKNYLGSINQGYNTNSCNVVNVNKSSDFYRNKGSTQQSTGYVTDNNFQTNNQMTPLTRVDSNDYPLSAKANFKHNPNTSNGSVSTAFGQDKYQLSGSSSGARKVASQLNNTVSSTDLSLKSTSIDLYSTDLPKDFPIENENLNDTHISFISINSYDSFFSDSDASRNELVVNNLLLTSDIFLKKAHELVLNVNTPTGTKDYFKMIKISIKSLLILIKKYIQCLNPQLESIVYFKLAKLYFTETENLNRADEYVNKAISISSRNNLIKIKFISEFLAAQILEKSNTKLLLRYLNEKINSYKQMGLEYFSNLFKLLKINNLFILEYSTGLVVLQSLSDDSNIDKFTKALCLLYQSNLHLYRGSPNQSLQLLNKVESLLLTSEIDYPIQLMAMFYLSKYSVYIQTNNFDEAKGFMQLISNFVLSEQKKNWKFWKEDGTFKVRIPINFDEVSSQLSYQVSWLNSDEFVIMFYFLTGINLLSEAYNGKNKAKKVFEKCLHIIEKQLKELTKHTESKRNFPLNQLNNKVLKLNYIKYNINYYQVWMNFLNDDFSDASYLNEFMNNYNDNKFTSEELCYYKLLIPKIFYLFGIYYQHKGDLQASKYYFIKVRNYSTHFKKPEDRTIPILQLSLGIGGESYQAENEYSELFVYSTLHLLMLNEFELNQISKIPNKSYNSKVNEYHKFSTILYEDLTQIFSSQNKLASNSFILNFTNSNKLVMITYKLLLSIYNGLTNDSCQFEQFNNGNQSLIQQLIETIENTNITLCFPYVNNLILYLVYLGTNNLEERNKYFQKCLTVISSVNSSDNDKILHIFILKSFAEQLKDSGEYDKAKMVGLQLQFLYNSLSEKFRLANMFPNHISIEARKI